MTITGYLPSPLLSIGFSIPRSIATVVVGVAVSQIIFVLSSRVHRHTIILLAPSVMMHLAVIASLTISIVSERRLGTLEDAPDGTASVVDAAGAVIAFVSFLAVLVIAGVGLLVTHASTSTPAPPPGAAAAAGVELRTLPETAVGDAADSSDGGSSTNSHSSTSSLEPVPAHVRLFESNISSQFRYNHAFLAEPVPSRSRMEA